MDVLAGWLPVQYVEGLGTPLGNSQLFSAHQMGSCRMSPVADQGVVDEEGQTHEVQGLYIVDASVFPTSLGTTTRPPPPPRLCACMVRPLLAHLLLAAHHLRPPCRAWCRHQPHDDHPGGVVHAGQEARHQAQGRQPPLSSPLCA